MTDPARTAYDAMAPIYDAFTFRNDYEAWFDVLIPKLEEFGLPEEGRLLDVACGTGRAFDPITACGWAKEILGCDISPEMVEKAREKYDGSGVELDVADMRDLPIYGPAGYELVWALNDAVNYLLGDDDLRLALESMARNVSDDGLLVFDVNTLRLFRQVYESPADGGELWTWEGRGQVDGIYEAELRGEGFEHHVHRERHRSVEEVQQAMRDACLEPVAAVGQRDDKGELAILDDWDEERDHKIVHVARRR